MAQGVFMVVPVDHLVSPRTALCSRFFPPQFEMAFNLDNRCEGAGLDDLLLLTSGSLHAEVGRAKDSQLKSCAHHPTHHGLVFEVEVVFSYQHQVMLSFQRELPSPLY